METLDEHNMYMYALNAKSISNKAGVACPVCGSEMIYYNSMPGTVLTSDPPKQEVKCQCGYRGYKVI